MAAVNPYEAPESVEAAKFITPRVLTKSDLLMVSFVSYAGTLVAACLMGFGMMGYAGAIIAPLIAMFSATPVTLVTFFTVWALSSREIRKRRAISTAAFSGGASGFLVFGWTAFFNTEVLAFSTVAGVLGAVGAAAAVAMYLRKFDAYQHAIAVTDPTWGDLA